MVDYSNLNKKELKTKLEHLLIDKSDCCKQSLKKFVLNNGYPIIQVELSEICPSYKIDLEETEKIIKSWFPDISDLTVISTNKEKGTAIWEMKVKEINIDSKFYVYIIKNNKINKLIQSEFYKLFAKDKTEGLKLWNKLKDTFGENTKYTNYIFGTLKSNGEDITYRLVKKINKKDTCLLCGLNLIEKVAKIIFSRMKVK